MGTLSSELKMVKEYLDKALKSINAKYRTIKLPEEPSMVVSQLPDFIDRIEVMNPDDAVTVDTVLCADCIQVDIPEGLHKQGIVKIQTQEKSVTPSKNSTTIEPDDKHVLTKVTVEGDNNLIPDNIKSGVTIFGVSGNVETEKPSQEKTVTPSNNSTTVVPDNGYTLSKVTVEGDSDLKSENIKDGIEIFGVSGSLKSYQQKATTVTATGTSFSVEPESGYLFNKVTVAGDNNLTASNIRKGVTVYGVTGNLESDVQLPTQEKTVTPTNSDTTVTPDSGYTLNKVTVKGDSDLKAENIKSGVSIFGITGSLESSQDVKTQSKTVTPGKNGLIVTPDSGYLLERVVVNGDLDLIPENIKEGISIFGVDGILPTTTTEVNTYDIIYVINEPGQQTEVQPVIYNNNWNITSNIPIVDGKTFVGWSMNSDGSGTVYTAGQSITTNFATKGSRCVLYASWGADNTSGDDNNNDNITEEINIFPSGEFMYLYNRGVTSDLVGGWSYSKDTTNANFTCSEEDSYLSLYIKQNYPNDDTYYSSLSSVNMIDMSGYHRLCFAYEVIGNDENKYLNNHLCCKIRDEEYTSNSILGLTPWTNLDDELDLFDYNYVNGQLVIDLDSYKAMSTETDIEYRIYAIWLEKTPNPRAEIAKAKAAIDAWVSETTFANNSSENLRETMINILKQAGVKDVEVDAFGILTRPATTSNAGSLDFSVRFYCANITEEIDYENLVIPKLTQ